MSDIGEDNMFDKMFAEINASLGTSMEDILAQIDCSLNTADLSENAPTDAAGYAATSTVTNNPMFNDASGPDGDFGIIPGPAGMGGLGVAGPGGAGAGIIDAGIGNTGISDTGIANSGISNSGIANFGIANTGITNTDIANAGIPNAGIASPGIGNTGVSNTDIANAGITNAGITNAGITNAGITNTGIANTGITNAGIADPAPHNILGLPGISAPEGTPGGSTLTVGDNSNEVASEAARLSYRMWVAIMRNDLRGVAALLRQGATPMMNLRYGGYALDMAVRMGHRGILVLFHRTSKGFADHGIRTLLTAVAEDKKDIIEAMLKMGMRGRLINDETLKLIFHGFACRHGTPEMLDFLEIHGTWWSWKSYGRWCLNLTHKTDAWANAAKIRELRARYMQREADKQPLVKVNDMMDPLPEDQTLKPIEEIVRLYCEKYPNVIIQDYFEDGYISPRHQNQGPAVGDVQTWVEYLHDQS